MPDAASASNLRSGLRVSILSIAWTLGSSALAIGLGVRASSLVLIAFGCTGLLDAAGSVALVTHFRHALRHETFSVRHERAAFLIVTVGLVVVAAATMAESLVRVASRSSGDHSLIGTGVAASSVVVLTSLARRKVRLGRAIPSKALVADGMLSTTGAVLALVTLLGTLLGVLGWWWADPVAALMVAIGALAVAVILARQ